MIQDIKKVQHEPQQQTGPVEKNILQLDWTNPITRYDVTEENIWLVIESHTTDLILTVQHAACADFDAPTVEWTFVQC